MGHVDVFLDTENAILAHQFLEPEPDPYYDNSKSYRSRQESESEDQNIENI